MTGRAMPLEGAALEDLFARLAAILDELPERDRPVFLAKLALLLAAEIGDSARVQTLIRQARLHLGPEDAAPGS